MRANRQYTREERKQRRIQTMAIIIGRFFWRLR